MPDPTDGIHVNLGDNGADVWAGWPQSSHVGASNIFHFPGYGQYQCIIIFCICLDLLKFGKYSQPIKERIIKSHVRGSVGKVVDTGMIIILEPEYRFYHIPFDKTLGK